MVVDFKIALSPVDTRAVNLKSETQKDAFDRIKQSQKLEVPFKKCGCCLPKYGTQVHENAKRKLFLEHRSHANTVKTKRTTIH